MNLRIMYKLILSAMLTLVSAEAFGAQHQIAFTDNKPTFETLIKEFNELKVQYSQTKKASSLERIQTISAISTHLLAKG